MNIDSLKSFIRTGGYAWPGGYQCALMMADGEVICSRSARANYRQIRDAMRCAGSNRDWAPIEVFIHWEGKPLICADSGEEIPSAYGETA